MKHRIVRALPSRVQIFLKKFYGRLFFGRCPKVFCIGLHKTGTTSIKFALREMGYVLGDQAEAETFIHDWAKRDFKRIINYCKTAQAFQDTPFSLPFTYIILDHFFPGSKFILTKRDSAEEWYNSLVKFHSKKFGDGKVPTKEDLKNAVYRYKGRPWEGNRAMFNSPENEPYKKDVLIKYYNNHLYNVKEYFRHRPDDLLILNLKEKDSYFNFCTFLNEKPMRSNFPWKNKT
jgi:hypothetical protein